MLQNVSSEEIIHLQRLLEAEKMNKPYVKLR